MTKKKRALIVRPSHQEGFTVVELVMVIILLSIISAVALPRFFDRSVFEDRASYDDIVNTLRFAQKSAVATGCPTQFQYIASENKYQVMRESICHDAIFDENVINPTTKSALINTLNSNALSTTEKTITFFPLGNASASATLTLVGKKINVIEQTGFINAQ